MFIKKSVACTDADYEGDKLLTDSIENDSAPTINGGRAENLITGL